MRTAPERRLGPPPAASKGAVFIVGAGPGDAGLITVRGLSRLRVADVVLYDRLVSPALLGEAPPRAERICVGKAPGRARLDQEAIGRLMIERAASGKAVVRLKGGDPFVFGRGGEEALALKEAGIPFEVVPGITSPVAVPASAGIPVTHRGLSGAFAVWTAHRSPGGAVEAVDAPTQVILMGTAGLEETVNRLFALGRSPSTPAAVISWGATVRQRTIFGTLADIAPKAREAGVASPATVIVGDVVGVGLRLAGADESDLAVGPPAGEPASAAGPPGAGNPSAAGGVPVEPADPWARLFAGKRVALTRKVDGDPLTLRLERVGAEPAALPALSYEPAPHPAFAATVRKLGTYRQVAFADAFGVREAMRLFLSAGQDARALGGVRVVALSGGAAGALREFGLAADATRIDPARPAVVIEGARGSASLPKEAGLRLHRVWAGEERPAKEVIRCLFDMAAEEMIDAVVFDGRRTWGAARALLKELDHAGQYSIAKIPVYIASGDRLAPAPLAGDREPASEER